MIFFQEKEGKKVDGAEKPTDAGGDENGDDSDAEELDRLDEEISALKEEERKAAKRLKKKKLKEKRKTAERINLKVRSPVDFLFTNLVYFFKKSVHIMLSI